VPGTGGVVGEGGREMLFLNGRRLETVRQGIAAERGGFLLVVEGESVPRIQEAKR
jgi:hypothetical protein